MRSSSGCNDGRGDCHRAQCGRLPHLTWAALSWAVVHVLRKLWGLPTWNPLGRNWTCRSDGTYSVAAAAELLDVFPGTIRRWLRQGVLGGWQAGEGTPWHVSLPEPEVARLRARLARTRHN